MKTIVVGAGGRENAIAWALALSPLVEEVIVCPGNGGTPMQAKCRALGGDPVAVAQEAHCALAVVGPEVPLAEGLADKFREEGIPCVGASKTAARLESSKDFAKGFMKRHRVACPASETFTDPEAAKRYIEQHGAPIVIKADGLAAGKGVTVAASLSDALAAVDDIMLSPRLGGAGATVVVEDYLSGVEMSVLAAVSVSPDKGSATRHCERSEATPTIVPFLPARDHKRLLDGAQGPNTGGMGAICPLPDVDDRVMADFREHIMEPTLKGLAAEGFDYHGFIFFGVMITDAGCKLLEYNVRLGDPETQAVLPLLETDFAELCGAIVNGTLSDYRAGGPKALKWRTGYVCSPCMVSGGYPGEYEKGKAITIDQAAVDAAGAQVFVAGATRQANRSEVIPQNWSLRAEGVAITSEAREGAEIAMTVGQLVTSGGRVLCCSAHGDTLDEAREKAYRAMEAIRFEGAFYRKDIGVPGAASSPSS